MSTHFALMFTTLNRFRLRIFSVWMALFLLVPAFADTASESTLAFFHTERKTLEANLAKDVNLTANSTWSNFSTSQANLDALSADAAVNLNLADQNVDSAELINVLNATNTNTLTASFLAYNQSLQSVQVFLRRADNFINLTSVPYAPAIRTSFTNLDGLTSILNGMSDADPVAFKLLVSAINEQDAYNKVRFYQDLFEVDAALATHVFYATAVQNAYNTSDKYLEFLDKLLSAALVSEAYFSSVKRYGNLVASDAAVLYLQDRIIASWKKINPGVNLRTSLIVNKKNNIWSNFSANTLIQEVINSQDVLNEPFYDISATYLPNDGGVNNLFVNRIIPPSTQNEFSGTAKVNIYTNSSGSSTDIFNLEASTRITGDLIVQSGTLNLNGYDLVVVGNLIQSGGVINVSGGRLLIGGNFLVQNSGAIAMTKAQDFVEVAGQFLMDSCVSHTNNLIAGTMELKGNFAQKTSCSGDATASNFKASGTHQVVFTGRSKQTISFQSPSAASGSQFATLLLNNESEEGIEFSSPVVVSSRIDGVTARIVNGDSLRLAGSAVQQDGSWDYGLVVDVLSGNLTLVQDQLVQDLYLQGNTLDLNGKTLTVKGSLFHSGGILKVSGGRLVVRGDYRVQTKNADGSFAQSSGSLLMNNALDLVEIDGQFVMDSCASHSKLLVAGKMDVKGDFTQLASCAGDAAASNFRASPLHQVVLSGLAKQTVSFSKPGGLIGSQFGVLILNNESVDGLDFATPVVVSTRLDGVTVKIANGDNMRLAGSAIQQDGSWEYGLTVDDVSGNLTLAQDQIVQALNIAGSTLNLNGKNLTVLGDLIHSGGNLNLSGGKLVVRGDYRVQSRNSDGTFGSSKGALLMTNDLDTVEVGGQFVMDSCVDHGANLVAGKLELKGNFTQLATCGDAAAGANFKASATHQVVLSGAGKQVVSFSKPGALTGSQFSILMLSNESAGGVELETPVVVGTRLDGITVKLINGDNVRLSGKAVQQDGVYEYGLVVDDLSGNWTMVQDQVVKNFYLKANTLNLNGKTLTVQGDLLHTGGVLRITGGKLVVLGNYVIQNSSALIMNNPVDSVEVVGNFVMDSCASHTSNLTAGTVDLKGNFSQKMSCPGDASATNFKATGTHTVVLSGRSKQVVNFSKASATTGSQFAVFKLANASSDGVEFASPVVVATQFDNVLTPINNNGYLKLAYLGSGGGLPADDTIEVPFVLTQGWNLLGNALSKSIDVATLFGDTTQVNTVWKWDVASSGWQFYAPSMDSSTLQSYVVSKGYKVLTVINPGEGYWVNAKTSNTFAAQVGLPFSLGAVNLSKGWNLVATANDISPSEFNVSLSTEATANGGLPVNVTTLWAWDNIKSLWYFYSPILDSNGGLASYIESKNYLDFSKNKKTLGSGIGFWVNRP